MPGKPNRWVSEAIIPTATCGPPVTLFLGCGSWQEGRMSSICLSGPHHTLPFMGFEFCWPPSHAASKGSLTLLHPHPNGFIQVKNRHRRLEIGQQWDQAFLTPAPHPRLQLTPRLYLRLGLLGSPVCRAPHPGSDMDMHSPQLLASGHWGSHWSSHWRPSGTRKEEEIQHQNEEEAHA